MDGQTSLIQQILRNPDVFNFADHNHHSIAYELLKVPPDMENREIGSWKSLELLDTLLALAEAGQGQAVVEMFQVPRTHCPDVLTLGLIQVRSVIHCFQSSVVLNAIRSTAMFEN